MKKTIRLVFALIALALCCVMTLTSCDGILQYIPEDLRKEYKLLFVTKL